VHFANSRKNDLASWQLELAACASSRKTFKTTVAQAAKKQ